MTVQWHPTIARRIPRRQQRLGRSALRIRLACNRLHGRRQCLRVAGRFSAIERVMRRTAVHSHRSLTAHIRLQALSAGGIARYTRRLEVRQTYEREARFYSLRRHERTLATERVLHERLIERLTRAEPAPATPRLSLVHRVEQRQGAPRLQLTIVKVQPPVARASPTATQAMVTAPSSARTGPSQPRFAPAASPLVLPPEELSRLADHVIRQLDHRVLSWQERTGRV